MLQLRVITEQTGIIPVALWNYSKGKLKNKGQQESSLSTQKELSFPLIEVRAVLFCFVFSFLPLAKFPATLFDRRSLCNGVIMVKGQEQSLICLGKFTNVTAPASSTAGVVPHNALCGHSYPGEAITQVNAPIYLNPERWGLGPVFLLVLPLTLDKPLFLPPFCLSHKLQLESL